MQGSKVLGSFSRTVRDAFWGTHDLFENRDLQTIDSTMKTLMCSLAAILSVALSSAVFAARDDDGEITGTVVRVNAEGEFEVDDGKGAFALVPAFDGPVPKVGEKVRVHYYHCGSGRKGFHHCADKIEKLGNADKGSKKK